MLLGNIVKSNKVGEKMTTMTMQLIPPNWTIFLSSRLRSPLSRPLKLSLSSATSSSTATKDRRWWEKGNSLHYCNENSVCHLNYKNSIELIKVTSCACVCMSKADISLMWSGFGKLFSSPLARSLSETLPSEQYLHLYWKVFPATRRRSEREREKVFSSLSRDFHSVFEIKTIFTKIFKQFLYVSQRLGCRCSKHEEKR